MRRIMSGCSFKYKGLNYPAEYMQPMKSHHYSVVKALENSEVDFTRYKGQGSKYRIPVKNRVNAEKVIASINSTFGKVLKTGKAIESRKSAKSILTEVVEVDVSNMAETLYHEALAQARVNKEADSNQYNIDGDIMPSMEDRIYKGTNVENLELANRKAGIMNERFSELGINSKVIFDTTLEANGKLVGKGTEEYKQIVAEGIVEEGQYAIVVNPNRLYDDTIFHEYGHLLVDILNGTNDARIQAVYDDLVDTTLYNDIVEAYPELSGEQLKREVVTQALGKKASELFTNQEQQSKWKRFLIWVTNTFNRLFNIDNGNQLTELANELLGNQEVNALGQVNMDTQYQKGTKEFKAAKIIERRLDSLSSIKEEIFRTLGRQIKVLDKIKDEKVQDYVDTIKSMQEEINALDKNADELAILKYVDRVNTQVDRMNKAIKSINLSTNAKVNLLGGFKEQLESFKLLADIRKAIGDQELFPDEVFKSEETRDSIITIIDDTQSLINTTHQNLQTEAINKVSLQLANYLNYAEVEARDNYFIEFNKNNVDREINEEYKKEREEYIQERLEENAALLTDRNRQLVKEKLRRSSVDIGAAAMLLNDEKDMNDIIIQLISKIIDDADLKRDTFLLDLKIDAQKLYNDYVKEYGSSNDPAKTFKELYEIASDGQAYITGEYSAEFHIKHKSLKNALGKAEEKYGKESKEYQTAKVALSNFINRETTDGKPNARWKNKNYSKIKDRELYQWLVKRTVDNDKKIQSRKSNLVQAKGHTLMKLPNISKSGFEEISSGSLLKNALESIKSTIYRRPDDTQYGEFDNEAKDSKERRKELYEEIKRRTLAGESVEELKDEINLLQVMTNEVGDVKTSIPIFFRGKTDLSTQSFDLMSIMLMDTYMAENYAQKIKMKYTADLVGDLINSREVNQTTGFSKKALVQIVGGNEDTYNKIYEQVRQKLGANTNAAVVYKSMIENRLYGIKTINAEYAQFANSLMAWTASAMLGFNFLAASANIIQGKVMNFIESVGGQWYDGKDLVAGEKAFWGDMGAWLDDTGRSVQTSKTNQLLDLFNIQGEFKPFTNRLNEDNRYKTLFKRSTLFAYNHMGEFYIHSTLMYAITNRIKIKNANGQYINSKGQVVAKDKAMTLSEALTVNKKTNKLELNKYAKATSFGNQSLSLTDLDNNRAILEVKNLINKIANDLHGQYNDEYQSYFQRHVLGQMVFMLRKWIVRGFNKRWRGATKARVRKEVLRQEDKFYSEDLQTFQEGHYTSFIRFLSRLTGNLKQMQWSGAVTEAKTNLTEHEIANIRKTFADIGVMALSILTALFTEMAVEGIDEDDDEAVLYLFFYSRRLYSELSFFADPSSTFDILRSPAASASYLEDITDLFNQAISDGISVLDGEGIEYYERGKNKGYPKLWKRTTDLIPILNHLDRTVYESASYVGNTK